MFDYRHLLGLEYIDGKQDCYSLARIYYREAWGLELPNFARPSRFWEDPNLDLYKMYQLCGFDLVIDQPYQIGDGLLMPLFTPMNTHGGVLVEPNKILHHLPGKLSQVDTFLPKWSSRVTVQVRHHLITEQIKANRETIHFHEVSNAHLLRNPEFKRQIEKLLGSGD